MLRSEQKRSSPCQRGVTGRVTVFMLGLLMLISAVLLVLLKTTSLSFVASATGAAGDSQLIFADGFEAQTAIISQPVTVASVDGLYEYQAVAEADPSLALSWTLLQAPADMIVDPQTGLVEWLPTTPGDFAVTLRVDDSREGFDEQSYTIAVSSNQPPVITSTPVTTAVEGQLYQYDVDAEDPELGDLNYSLAVAPTGMTINATTGLIEWTPAVAGDFPVTVVVRDTGMATATQSFTIVVEPAPDQAPIFVSEPILTGAIDEPYSYQAEAVDPEGGTVTYNLISAPTGVTLVSATGLISWTPAFPGTVPMVLEAVDANGLTSEQSFAVDISAVDGVNPPEWQSEDSMIAPLGRTTRFQMAAADQDKDTLRYFIEPLPLPANMKMNSLTGLLEFAPDLDQVGDHTFEIVVSDGRFRIHQSFVITVPPPSGVTTLEGRVQEGLSDPLPGVRIVIDGHERVTDADGYFKFEGLSVAGDVPMLVDGTTVPSAETYATIPKQVHLIAGADNVLQDPIILLPLDTASADFINPAAESSITSAPVMKGGESFAPVTLTIPAGQAVWEDTGELFSGSMHITDIADNKLSPQPLPPELDFSVYVAMQPFGIVYNEPVPISFPNVEGLLPGTRMEVFGLDHTNGDFVKFGDAEVSADGQTVDSIGGVVVANSWHGVVLTETDGEGDDDDNDDECEKQCGSKAGLSKGNLNIAHATQTYTSLNQQRGISLVYNSTSAEPKPVIKFTQTNPSRSALGTATTSARLNVGGVTFTSEQYWTASAQPASGAQQFDATGCPSEVYDWQIELSSSIPERFGKRTTTIGGKIALINLSDSPFGTGWHIQGLEQIIVGPTGDAMIIDGSAESIIFRSAGSSFVSPNGDFTELTSTPTGFQRRFKNGDVITYRSDGRMVEMRDRNGNVTSYTYDPQGRLIAIIDPLGLTTNLSYFSDQLRSITDPAGRITRFEHDSFGNLSKIIEPDGSFRTFAYQQGSTGRITSQSDHLGNVTSYTYDNFGLFLTATRPDGSVAGSRSSLLPGLIDPSSGNGGGTSPAASVPESEVFSSLTDGNGNEIKFKNDARGRPIEIIDDLGRSTVHERNADSLATRTQRADGSVVTRTFDEFGNTLSSTEAFNNATTTWTYDAFSQVTSTTDARGNVTTIDRDANGNATRITNALGHITDMEYDQRGLLIRTEDPNGLITEIDYNDQGLPATVTQTAPNGDIRVTQNSYDAAGQLLQRIAPDGVTSNMSYDQRGRLISVTDNLGQSQINVYDAASNLLKVEIREADGTVVNRVEHAYDSRNRRIETILPHESDLATTAIELDGEGNTTGIIDPTSNITLFQYDAVDRLVTEVNAEGGVTAYQYDALDNLIRVVAPNGAETTFDVDALSRITAEHSPDRGTLQYSYDQNNNRIQFTDARGIVASYSYDALNRLTAITYPDPAENVTMTYDNCNNGIGRLCQVTDESGQYDYSYDVFGNQLMLDFTPVNTSETLTTEYVYDSGDNVVQITYPSGRVINYTRDELSRIIAVDAIINGMPQNIVSNIEYRADGLITQMTHGNAMITVMDYDLQGRMLDKTLLAQDASTVVDERFYEYDADNNITARTGTPGDHSYSYDAVDRLIEQDITGAENIQYRYDLNGKQAGTHD